MLVYLCMWNEGNDKRVLKTAYGGVIVVVCGLHAKIISTELLCNVKLGHEATGRLCGWDKRGWGRAQRRRGVEMGFMRVVASARELKHSVSERGRGALWRSWKVV